MAHHAIPLVHASFLPAIPVDLPPSATSDGSEHMVPTERERYNHWYRGQTGDAPAPAPAPARHTDEASFYRLTGNERSALVEEGYTEGLIQALERNKRALPLAIWVVDNSGSMANRDGHRLVPAGNGNYKVVHSTRWAEMQQTVDYQAQLAARLQKATVFRLLNDPGCVCGPQQFSVAERGRDCLDEDLAVATSTIHNASPTGATPLVQHVREIVNNVSALQESLRRDGTKVAVILATDGIPTDDQGYTNDLVKSQFAKALRSLRGLPVWIVVRLCTDEESVVNYWNDLDANLELNLEVLDDFTAEAKEVHEHNKWLNYSLPLHRIRETGFHDPVFDLIDERPLTKEELFGFFRILFGAGLMDGVPDPEADWNAFVARIASLNQNERKQWNPLTRRLEPWIDIRRLRRDYGGGWFTW